jgi:hypothetical protein
VVANPYLEQLNPWTNHNKSNISINNNNSPTHTHQNLADVDWNEAEIKHRQAKAEKARQQYEKQQEEEVQAHILDIHILVNIICILVPFIYSLEKSIRRNKRKIKN